MFNPSVGIDLGTTNSCVAVLRNNKVEIIENRRGFRTTPSYVGFSEEGMLVGYEAKDEATRNIKNTIYESKRLIGQKFSDEKVQEDINRFPFNVFNHFGDPKIKVNFQDEEKQFYPEEIGAFILQEMKSVAEDRLGTEVKRAVVTVPAYFNDAQRQATKNAATIAGFETVSVINEPTAAALAFIHENKNNHRRNIVVFDFGGGTFDVSIVTVAKGMCDVKATKGDSHLGGTDIDMNLVKHLVKEFYRKYQVDLNQDYASIRRLKARCEQIKERLSGQTKSVPVDLDRIIGDEKAIDSIITRAGFEHLNKDLFEKTLNILKKCLKDAGMKKEDIDEVVLVGGSSRIPKVQKLLNDYFGEELINKGVNPDEAVAYGAAIHAYNLRGDHSEVHDVTSLSLGTNTLGDFLSTIIPRNTPIPAVAVKKYQTIRDDQTTMEFPVYQGEREIASENYELGYFNMTGLTPAPAKEVKVEVCFKINAEGMLNITAEEVNTENNIREIQIDMNRKGLNHDQIKEKIKEAEQYRQADKKRRKFHDLKYELEELCVQVMVEAEEITNETAQTDLLNKCKEIELWLKQIKIDMIDEIYTKKVELDEVFKEKLKINSETFQDVNA